MYYPGCRRFIDKITYCRMWHLSLTRPTSTRVNEFLSSGIDWLHMCARVYASHLSHRCQRYKVSIMLRKRRWFGEKPSATITEKTNCIYEMNVAQNITDILLLTLVTELWVRLWWSEFKPMVSPDLMSTTDVNVTRHQSCSKSQEVLDQAWRDSVPGKRSCQFLDLNNLNRWFGEKPSATIARSLCIVKLIKKRCLSVLIDV